MSTATLPTLPETTQATEIPTVAEIDRITAMSDLILRNLLITRSYHLLSAALARSLGSCANWCTHAKWASKQAGQTIRREDLARVLEQHLAAAPGLSRALGDVVAAALPFGARLDPLGLRASVEKALLAVSPLERASDAVSRGNHKVFAEIGREVARFLATCAEGPSTAARSLASSTGCGPGSLRTARATSAARSLTFTRRASRRIRRPAPS